MNRPPELYIADEIAYFPEAHSKAPNGTYFTARPYVPFSTSFSKRLTLAIGVFFGKYDVIFFKEDESEEDGLIRRERQAKRDALWNKKNKKVDK